jgi:hypothetical protein
MSERDFNSYEKNYVMLPFEPIMIEYRRKIVIENLLKHKHDHILEIGCGNEPLFKYFPEYSSMTIVEPCYSFYQNAIKKEDSNITVYNGTFDTVADSVKKANYDFIVISCLLHEIENPIRFLNNIYDVCGPETTVHINVPNAESFHRVLALKSNLIENIYHTSETQELMQQFCVYNMEMLKKLVFNCNFKVIDEGSYFLKPFTHFQMQALLDQNIISRAVLDGLFEIIDLLPGWGAEIFVNVRANN